MCLTLCDPMHYNSLSGSSICGIFQARVLEWVAISFSRGSSQPGDQTLVSCIAGDALTSEPPEKAPSKASVQFSHSVMSDSLQLHELQHTRPPCPSPTPGVYSNMSIESVMRSNHLILCCPLLLSPSIFPSIRVFFNELVLRIRWPQYCSFSFSISPSNEYSGLISFRMD